jgi:hypothetical protein
MFIIIPSPESRTHLFRLEWKGLVYFMQAHGCQRVGDLIRVYFQKTFFIIIILYMWTSFSYNPSLAGRPSCLYRNGFTHARKWNWCVGNKGPHWRFTNVVCSVQYITFSYGRLIVIYFRCFLTCFDLERIDFSRLEIILYSHEFCFYETLDCEMKVRCVGRKARWRMHLCFFFGKVKPARFFGILSL